MGEPIPHCQCLCQDLQQPHWEGAMEAGVGAPQPQAEIHEKDKL